MLRTKKLQIVLTGSLALLLTTGYSAGIVLAQTTMMSTTNEVAAADTTFPSDVEKVKAVAKNGAVELSWDVATDDTGVTGYKIYYGTKPVMNAGDQYEFGPLDVGNKIKNEVTALQNGTKYYFTVTAYDAAGNESENYSTEVSATPGFGAADKEAPKVLSAEAVYRDTLRIVFSEPVVLPSAPASSISLKNDTTQAVLEVKKVELDATDSTGKTLLVTTAVQQTGTSYIVTASSQLKDAAGNPIVSGTSDTAVFKGTDKEPLLADATTDKTPPELADVQVTDKNTVVVEFSEPVKLTGDGLGNFIITEEENIDNTLDIQKVVLAADGKSVTLTTSAQQNMNYNLVVYEIADTAGNKMSFSNNATTFKGKTTGGEVTTQEPATQEDTQEATQEETQQTQEADKTPPEDATKLMTTLMEKMMVELQWVGSLDSAGDLANYVLYKSTDDKSFGQGMVLSASENKYDFSDLTPGTKYYFKLTAQDKVGNESKGILTSFILPETGPELGLLLFGSLGLGKFMKRKNKK